MFHLEFSSKKFYMYAYVIRLSPQMNIRESGWLCLASLKTRQKLGEAHAHT